MKTMSILILALTVLLALGCKSDSGEQEAAVEEPAVTETTVAEATEELEMFTKESGVRYQELVVGSGVEAVNGMNLECDYTLWLGDATGLVKGTKIDSSIDRGNPFACTLGRGLIQGWTDGMIGMKAGGKRIIYVPWNLGYGERGAGDRIPPRSNLIFEIEFLRPL
jgi:FKBP-type peptidyl-prolyl cis-trans isomerase